MTGDSYVIVECKRMKLYEYGKIINEIQMQENVRNFLDFYGKARVLSLEELKTTRTAYFQLGHLPKGMGTINLSNILTEWELTDTQLIAIKLWRVRGELEVEVYKFPLENYGKTWRCWSGVPDAEQIEAQKWKKINGVSEEQRVRRKKRGREEDIRRPD